MRTTLLTVVALVVLAGGASVGQSPVTLSVVVDPQDMKIYAHCIDHATLEDLLRELRAAKLQAGELWLLGYVGDNGDAYALTETDLREAP